MYIIIVYHTLPSLPFFFHINKKKKLKKKLFFLIVLSHLPLFIMTSITPISKNGPKNNINSKSNSTCPSPSLPQNNDHKKAPQYQLSKDLTNLYALYTSVPKNNNAIVRINSNVVCFCCEREIVGKSLSEEEERKRKVDDYIADNKVATALFYGSNRVRDYMKKVMKQTSWNNILKEGFPCPHSEVWSDSNRKRIEHDGHYYCTLCETEKTQDTLRLTLTPIEHRAQDKDIYGEYQHVQHNNMISVLKKKNATCHRFV